MKLQTAVRFVLTAGIILALARAGAIAGQERDLPMTLDSCILAALKHNLGVAVEVINPRLSEMNYRFAKEKFVPALSFGFSSADTSSASYSYIEAAAVVSSLDKNYAASITQPLPTGGQLSASVSSYRSESNRSFQTINPRFGSTLSFSFSQPLLRGFGLELNRRSIVIARNNLQISETQFESVLLDLVYRVESAYWSLVFAVESLNVHRQSLDLARDLLTKNRREVEVGTIAPIEILNAEAEVATREADILAAENQVSLLQDRLLTLINFPAGEGALKVGRVIPLEKPAAEARAVVLEECLSLALAHRPDLAIYRLNLANQSLQYDYARNQLLPDLRLSVQYWSPGVSGTQILYQDGNALSGIVTGVIPGGASESLRDAFRFLYKNYSIGLSLSIPLANYLTKEHFAAARLSYDKALLQVENARQQIFLEIRSAVKTLETDYRRVQAYRAARELSERKLAAEEKKLKVGLTTNYLFLWQQRDLAGAKSAELKAMIDYRLSLANLERALGTGLISKGIRTADVMLTQDANRR
ncbi:MAG: TolC family protein [Candidatus Aminicenantes bacterium]|nr:TolC family protein [Candidatus Aminicenantes bacterium]